MEFHGTMETVADKLAPAKSIVNLTRLIRTSDKKITRAYSIKKRAIEHSHCLASQKDHF